MGIDKNFFTKPVLVPVTFREKTETDGGIQENEYQVIFKMNRETAGAKKALEVAASLFSDADNLERFCKQLACEPEGIDDFPKDARPLAERAREYFTDAGYGDVIQYVVMEVERAQKPLEFFRSF